MPKGRASARAQRAQKARAPKLVEDDKSLLGLRGSTSSPIGMACMKDLLTLKKPDSKGLSRKNDIRPLEDASSIEFLASKNGCSAFLYTSHNKKRPHNLVLGRMFDDHVLDQVELGISSFAPIESFRGPKKLLGAVPCFVFAGDAWERVPELTRLQNLILDVFGGRNLTHLALRGVDHVISVTAVEPEGDAAIAPGTSWRGTIHWRTYFCSLLRSGNRVPKVELSNMGPSIDLTLRRTALASPDLWKAALKQPAAIKSKRPKNVTRDELGVTSGTVHMQRQDFSTLNLKKTKATRGGLRDGAGAEGGGGEEEGDEGMDEEEESEAPRQVGQKSRRS